MLIFSSLSPTPTHTGQSTKPATVSSMWELTLTLTTVYPGYGSLVDTLLIPSKYPLEPKGRHNAWITAWKILIARPLPFLRGSQRWIVTQSMLLTPFPKEEGSRADTVLSIAWIIGHLTALSGWNRRRIRTIAYKRESYLTGGNEEDNLVGMMCSISNWFCYMYNWNLNLKESWIQCLYSILCGLVHDHLPSQ